MIKQQFSKFVIIGVFSTIINYATFYIFYEFLKFHYILSSAIGFMLGVIVGYGFNKNWAFGVKGKNCRYIYKYYIVYTISLFLGLGFLKFLVSVLEIMPEISNFLTIGLTTCTNFIGIKFWVFKK